jgi:hypothetical protein
LEVSPYLGILPYHSATTGTFQSVREFPDGTCAMSMNIITWPLGLDVTQLPDPLPSILPYLTPLNATHSQLRHFATSSVTAVEEVFPTLMVEGMPPTGTDDQFVKLWWRRELRFLQLRFPNS